MTFQSKDFSIGSIIECAETIPQRYALSAMVCFVRDNQQEFAKKYGTLAVDGLRELKVID